MTFGMWVIGLAKVALYAVPVAAAGVVMVFWGVRALRRHRN